MDDELKLDRIKLEKSLETIREDMATLQYQWEEERKRSSQLMREKMRLEKEMNAIKLSSMFYFNVVNVPYSIPVYVITETKSPLWQDMSINV